MLLGERAPSLRHKSCQVHCPNPASGLGGQVWNQTHLCIRPRDMTEEGAEAERESESRRRDSLFLLL